MAAAEPEPRRRLCTPTERAAAVAVLEPGTGRISAANWPGPLERLDHPGLYSWWADARSAAESRRDASDTAEGSDTCRTCRARSSAPAALSRPRLMAAEDRRGKAESAHRDRGSLWPACASASPHGGVCA